MSRTVSAGASCKHCGGTVLIIVTGLLDLMPHYKGHSGGVTSTVYPKCHKTSLYTVEIYEHQFRSLR